MVGHPTYHVNVIKLKMRDYMDSWFTLDLLTSRAFERERAKAGFVPGPTTPDQKTKRTTLRKSRFIPPKQVTSPTWGPPPPCKQALSCKLHHKQSGKVP